MIYKLSKYPRLFKLITGYPSYRSGREVLNVIVQKQKFKNLKI